MRVPMGSYGTKCTEMRESVRTLSGCRRISFVTVFVCIRFRERRNATINSVGQALFEVTLSLSGSVYLSLVNIDNQTFIIVFHI